jgi:glycosyltransferase involved in cell wall biosynthesis
MLSPLLVRALGLRERGDIIPSVDQIYYDWWDIQLMLLQQRHRFDVVFAEYIFVSRALSVFPGSVHKLIDTIDIFSDRDELMREKRNIASNWLSTDTASEGLALGRGDVSIGIQDDESAELRKLTTGKVVTVGHFIDLVDCPRPTPTGVGQRLLFIGSSNALNVDGCAWFIDQVLDRVAAELPQVRLRIVGGVSQPLAERYADDPRLDIVGRVETLDQEYAAADVVINPVLFGTGLATKSIEALAHGAAMLCTAEGARGIPMDVAGGPPCGVAVTAESFADQLIELLKDPALRQRYQQSATAFVHDWNQQQAANLAAVLRP